MAAVATMIRGARNAFRANVTLDGKEVGGRMFPVSPTGGRSIPLVGGNAATYEELYRTQPWIRIVVNKLARTTARLPLKVYVNPDEPNERERVRDGALVELLKHPGGRKGTGELVREIVSNVALHGNHVVVKSRRMVGVPPYELLSTSFVYWDVVSDANGNRWYVYSPNRGPAIPFTPEEVLHFSWWKPGAGLKAPSPLESLRTTLMLEDASQRAAIASFENGMRQSGFFSAKGAINESQFERIRAQLTEKYGGPDNALRVILLDNDIDWKAMSNDAQESELINVRKLAREEVAAVLDIPPPVIGILDRATFSNITEQHLMLYQDTIEPWTDMIQEVLQVQLIEDEALMSGQYAEFDFGAVLAGDPVKQVDTLTKAVGGPFMVPNEARALRNLPPIDSPEANELRPAPNASLKGDAANGGDQSST